MIGATIFGFGIYLLTKSTDLKHLIDTPDTGAIIVTVTGACVFLISFFGCFGAIKENQCMLKTVNDYHLPVQVAIYQYLVSIYSIV